MEFGWIYFAAGTYGAVLLASCPLYMLLFYMHWQEISGHFIIHTNFQWHSTSGCLSFSCNSMQAVGEQFSGDAVY